MFKHLRDIMEWLHSPDNIELKRQVDCVLFRVRRFQKNNVLLLKEKKCYKMAAFHRYFPAYGK